MALDGKLAVSTAHGLAPGSLKKFKTHINTYVTFCSLHDLNLFPADVLQIRRFIQYLSEFHQTVDSSKNYRGGVRALHQVFGITPPDIGDYLYQLTVNGIRRDKAHIVKQA